MKLDYLLAGSKDCPLVRLFDFTPTEAQQFFAAASQLGAGGESVVVDELPFVDALGNCKLTLQVTEWDQGVTQDRKAGRFICGLTTGTWDNVAGLIEPFVKTSSGF